MLKDENYKYVSTHHFNFMPITSVFIPETGNI